METRDDIASQALTQLSRDRWNYTVRTRSGLQYVVAYAVQPFGFIKETLARVSPEGAQTLIWDRDFKVGENVRETWIDRIRKG